MYRLSDEQAHLIGDLRDLAAARIAPHAARVDEEGSFPSDALRALGEAGWLGLTVPAAYGGRGQSLGVACAALDEIAQHCSSTAMVYLMHLCGLACYLAAPDRTAEHLEAAARGAHLSTLAFSEHGSRSHFWAPVSRAVARNGRVQLSAEKSFVTSAGHADGYVVSALAPNASGPLDSTIYLVLRHDPGVSVSGRWQGLGMRGNASAPMRLAGVTLGPERALTADGAGLSLMLSAVLPMFQLGSAAIAVGIAEAAVRATQQHLTTARFDHLGAALADLPTLRARLAEMRLETDRARAHLVAAIEAIERGTPAAQLLLLESKAAAAEGALKVTDLAMRACGGAAYGRRLGLERLFRDARAPAVMAPTTDHLLEFIGRALCGMEVFG
ncbi:MAG TPA: acyl-CoA dehydrogenase family protein [Vicinamibacterales bacterium]|nr:acyl-CoA dehydrogenase family protein [Vicinamibacterales bacterium]